MTDKEADRFRKLQEEVFALRKDAERYRAIRIGLSSGDRNPEIAIGLFDDFGAEMVVGCDADATIDEYLGQQK